MARSARSLAITFLSAGTVAYEILLVRVFAIEQFYHFAYMAIGVAMLGFGAAGTLLALARPGARRSEHWFRRAALATPIALLASAAIAHLIPLDPTQLPWDARQWWRLGALYIVLALPFAAGGLAVLAALVLEPQHTGRLYGSSFLGAGIGVTLALAVLWLLVPARALAMPAAVASLGSLAALSGWRWTGRPAAVIVALLAVLSLFRPPWRMTITPYKGLPQVEAYPDARRTAQRTRPLGWVVAVDAPAFRHAPGLSLAYRGPFPRQTALFVDGTIAGALSHWSGPDRDLTILDWLPTAAPYALAGRNDVLVIGAGGGTEVWNGLAHGAKVRAVELNPDLVELAGWHDTREGAAGSADVRWTIGDARRYAAASRERFDLVTLAAGRAFGTAAAGVYALNEDFLHTVDAYAAYLKLLDEGGVLAITRWLTLPPRSSVRVILTAADALERVAPGDLIDKLVVVRSWATVTVLVKPAGFSPADVHALLEWTRARRFDLDWYPGIEAPARAFNLMDEPVLYRAAAAATSGPAAADAFARAYPFDVAPVGDARPYPHHFLRPGSLVAFLRGDRGDWLPFAEWGFLALVATLIQSALIAALLMLAPVLLRARPASAGLVRLVLYFSAIGLAYLAAEIAAIQQLTLLLGHPVYAVAAVLAALLVFSGAGSAWSDRRPPPPGPALTAGLAALLTLYAAALLPVVHRLQPAPLTLRGTAAALVLLPAAFLMGMPFPVGMRRMAGPDTGKAAWAWAANGFASVVALPLAALISLEAGSRMLLLAAALAYAGAAATQRAG